MANLSNKSRTFGALILFFAALILFAHTFTGCASTSAAPTKAGDPKVIAKLPPLQFEIVHQQGMDVNNAGRWATHKIGHVVNNRTVAVEVTIECDWLRWTETKIPARSDLWFLMGDDDKSCNVTRTK